MNHIFTNFTRKFLCFILFNPLFCPGLHIFLSIASIAFRKVPENQSYHTISPCKTVISNQSMQLSRNRNNFTVVWCVFRGGFAARGERKNPRYQWFLSEIAHVKVIERDGRQVGRRSVQNWLLYEHSS